MRVLGEHSYRHGVALLALDTRSDSYAVTFMPTDLAERIAGTSCGWVTIMRRSTRSEP
ncbi:DUF6630 family protein [Nocardia seriolae]|uniref:DUF6630 family protein n=1 Tax=Nocardia seriolae TaxID=37332 RepID=UPI003D1613F9